MKALSYFFFYTYVGLVVLAGFWGAFIHPGVDFRLMFNLDTHQLTDFQRINLVSQYRFLRALELGFGVFSLLFTREIFTLIKFNRLFLFIMFSGIVARVFSLLMEGSPSGLTWFFMSYEFIGVVLIFIYTQKNIALHANA